MTAVPAATAQVRHRPTRWPWLLLVGALVAATLFAARWRAPAPAPPAPPAGNIVYVDVAGWYGRTPAEVAVRTPFTLTLDGLPEGLPMALGAWRGEDRPHDPAVDVWLRSPEVVVERTYRSEDGGIVWLSIFGSRGTKSYRLFEHTPESCYPLGGWQVRQFEVMKLPRTARPLPVNFGRAESDRGELVFAHLYVWDTPSRDPERGVLSFRLAAPVRTTIEATSRILERDFLDTVFPHTLSWRRF